MKLFERLKAFWIDEKIFSEGTEKLDSLITFEDYYGIKLPDNVKDYFCQFDGTTSSDSNMFSFFALNDLQFALDYFRGWKGSPDFSEAIDFIEKQKLKCFVFVEYMVYSSCFALTFSVDGEFLGVYKFDLVAKKLSSSFSDFLELYLNDDELLYD